MPVSVEFPRCGSKIPQQKLLFNLKLFWQVSSTVVNCSSKSIIYRRTSPCCNVNARQLLKTVKKSSSVRHLISLMTLFLEYLLFTETMTCVLGEIQKQNVVLSLEEISPFQKAGCIQIIKAFSKLTFYKITQNIEYKIPVCG